MNSRSTLLKKSSTKVGNTKNKVSDGTAYSKNIMGEIPQLMKKRRKILDSEKTGNCRPWSHHVFNKLFLDTNGCNATLVVLKCEITYVDLFTDEEHLLYNGRFIGGKKDGVAQMLTFDLIKAMWEEKIPRSQAAELNLDIVMSSSPTHQCTKTICNFLHLEKAYLKHLGFQGQLNFTIRFAHSYEWNNKIEASKTSRIHEGLRNLSREGVNLEIMSVDNILEEMRVCGIHATNEEKINYYVEKRQNWKRPPTKSTKPVSKKSKNENNTENSSNPGVNNYGKKQMSTPCNHDYKPKDLYYVSLYEELGNII